MSSQDYNLELTSNLSDIIQREVNRLSRIMYKNDDCKPYFKVSINCDKSSDQVPDLYLICTHRGYSVNRKIDLTKKPDDFDWYGQFNLKLFMEYLYNCTM